MIRETVLDASLECRISPSADMAEQRASREAADTGGVVLRIRSIRIGADRIVLVGLIPSDVLVFEHPSRFPASLRPRSTGNLHLTRCSLDPGAGDEIGYLVLQTPVATKGLLPESEDGDSYWVSITIPRNAHDRRLGCVGAVCCARCNRPISQQRLAAVPNAKFCTNCQQKKENQ